jgi:hypothetical protein
VPFPELRSQLPRPRPPHSVAADQALRSSHTIWLISADRSAVIVMVPMMAVAINRAVCPPMVMIPRVDAEGSVHTADSTADGTSDDSTSRTGGPASL